MESGGVAPPRQRVQDDGDFEFGALQPVGGIHFDHSGDGGFGCISGSHRAEEPLPAGAEAMIEAVPQPAGSLLIFTEGLFHCTVPWRGAEDRFSLLFKFCPGSMAYARLPAVPADVLPELTPRQRALAHPPCVDGHPLLPR